MRWLLALASCSLLAGTADSLTGRWQSTEVSPAGVSTVFEFYSDHKLDSSAAVVRQEQYRLIGTDTIAFKSQEGGEIKRELEWENSNNAHIDDEPAGKAIPLTRNGKVLDAKNPLLGEWATQLDWKGKTYTARAVFLPGGKVYWITYIRSQHGTYSLNNQTIRIEIADRPALEGAFQLSGDVLTLPNPRGGTSEFQRF